LLLLVITTATPKLKTNNGFWGGTFEEFFIWDLENGGEGTVKFNFKIS
jgi:hypothetical protein